MHDNTTPTKSFLKSRRSALAATLGVTSLFGTGWVKPLVKVVSLPAHARTSETIIIESESKFLLQCKLESITAPSLSNDGWSVEILLLPIDPNDINNTDIVALSWMLLDGSSAEITSDKNKANMNSKLVFSKVLTNPPSLPVMLVAEYIDKEAYGLATCSDTLSHYT